jgi:hypothetical protein
MRKINWLFAGGLLLALSAGSSQLLADDAPDAGPAASAPQRERDLVDIVMDARKQFQTSKTANPAQDARMSMQMRVIAYMRQSQVADDWVGTVKTRGITPDGKAWITVEIADGITVSTWTSQADDLDSGTLIRPSAPLFATVQQAKIGSTVIFGGTILKSVLATDDEMVLRPQFIAHFNALKITQ